MDYSEFQWGMSSDYQEFSHIMVKNDDVKGGTNKDGKVVPTTVFGRRFDSEVFTITVGNTESRFIAHVNVLSQSPVLACMCNGPFCERLNWHINLPEDDAADFGLLLEFLYREHLPELICTGSSAEIGRLADIYILADKYQVQNLKEAVVSQLSSWRGLYNTPLEFFRMAHKIYQNSSHSESDKCFQDYFVKEAKLSLFRMTTANMGSLEKLLDDGGKFAASVFRIQHNKVRESETIKQQLELKLAEAQQELEVGARRFSFLEQNLTNAEEHHATASRKLEKQYAIASRKLEEQNKQRQPEMQTLKDNFYHTQHKYIIAKSDHTASHGTCTTCRFPSLPKPRHFRESTVD